MNCDDLLRRLTDYGDGALESGLCAEIEHHLAACSPCDEVRLDLLRLARLCRECDPPRLPAETRERIERMLRAHRR